MFCIENKGLIVTFCICVIFFSVDLLVKNVIVAVKLTKSVGKELFIYLCNIELFKTVSVGALVVLVVVLLRIALGVAVQHLEKSAQYPLKQPGLRLNSSMHSNRSS